MSVQHNGAGNGAGTAIAILTAVVGGVALVGTGAGAAVASAVDITRTDETQTADVDGVTAFGADMAAGNVSIRFEDVEEAQLNVTGASDGRWVLERDDDELVLRDREDWLAWGLGAWSWFGSSVGEERVELILPESLAGVDADLTLGAGRLVAEGDFGALDVELAAGYVNVTGSATSLDARLSAGSAEFEIADAEDVDLELSAGRLVAEITGEAPRRVDLEVSAGALDLTLPDVAYSVSQDVSAGTLDNRLQTRSDGQNSVSVNVSAGSATLRAGD